MSDGRDAAANGIFYKLDQIACLIAEQLIDDIHQELDRSTELRCCGYLEGFSRSGSAALSNGYAPALCRE